MPSSRWKSNNKIEMRPAQLKTNIIGEYKAVEGLIQCLSSSKWNSAAALSRPQPSCPPPLTRPQRRLLANVVLRLAGHDPPSLTHPPHDHHARDRQPRRPLSKHSCRLRTASKLMPMQLLWALHRKPWLHASCHATSHKVTIEIGCNGKRKISCLSLKDKPTSQLLKDTLKKNGILQIKEICFKFVWIL